MTYITNQKRLKGTDQEQEEAKKAITKFDEILQKGYSLKDHATDTHIYYSISRLIEEQ